MASSVPWQRCSLDRGAGAGLLRPRPGGSQLPLSGGGEVSLPPLRRRKGWLQTWGAGSPEEKHTEECLLSAPPAFFGIYFGICIVFAMSACAVLRCMKGAFLGWGHVQRGYMSGTKILKWQGPDF